MSNAMRFSSPTLLSRRPFILVVVGHRRVGLPNSRSRSEMRLDEVALWLRRVNLPISFGNLVCGERRRNKGMLLTLTAICIAVLFLLIVFWMKRTRSQREMEQHSVTAEDLHSLLASSKEVLLFDVRQPLDLLAYPETIPGAQRIPPREVVERPSLIPTDREAVVYCTCPGDKTSRAILHRALAMHFSRIKFLKGGLAAWKAKGYPVEPYKETFHLYVPSSAPSVG
jgi:rhodanese-related sulfurtransferase